MQARLLSASLPLVLTLFSSLPTLAQYNAQAGRSLAPAAETVRVETVDANGQRQVVEKRQQVRRDAYGNAATSNYDLAVDGAFTGQTVLVVDLYGQPFQHATDALRQKGFGVVRYQRVPPVAELKTALTKSNQFWMLASCDNSVHLTPAHQAAIKQFFNAGHGVYIWGDNDPCNADANALAQTLIGVHVRGDVPGDRVVGISKGRGKPGVVLDHLLTTGLEYLYEGVTVATVYPDAQQSLTPIVYGSAGNLVTAAYELDNKRLIVDGGYTRLDYKWDTAGTGRYVMNAAAWLANYERFGKNVVAQRATQKTTQNR